MDTEKNYQPHLSTIHNEKIKDKWGLAYFFFPTYTQNHSRIGLTLLIFSASIATLRSQFNQRLVQNPGKEEKYLKYINFSDSSQEFSMSWHKNRL